MIMKASEIAEAIVEYLAKRGVQTDGNHIYIDRIRVDSLETVEARITDVKLEIGAPYR